MPCGMILIVANRLDGFIVTAADPLFNHFVFGIILSDFQMRTHPERRESTAGAIALVEGRHTSETFLRASQTFWGKCLHWWITCGQNARDGRDAASLFSHQLFSGSHMT